MSAHTYVECCDRQPLIESTERIRMQGSLVRVCREGMGCDNNPGTTATGRILGRVLAAIAFLAMLGTAGWIETVGL